MKSCKSNEGELFGASVVVKLFDATDKEIGMTIGGSKEIAYAMSQSERIVKAVSHSSLFGNEITERVSFTKEIFDKVRNQHKLGEHLLFWVGEPLVRN